LTGSQYHALAGKGDDGDGKEKGDDG
jgi:hypothetical protein